MDASWKSELLISLGEADESFAEHLVVKRLLSEFSQWQSMITEVKVLKFVKYQH